MKVVIPVFLATLVTAGCTALGGDMIVRVSGTVPVPGVAKNPEKQCALGMVSVETGEQLSARDVPSDFSTRMMVVAGPKPKHYYFIAECGEGRKFRSNTVAVSSRSSYARDFELGTLVESVP